MQSQAAPWANPCFARGLPIILGLASHRLPPNTPSGSSLRHVHHPSRRIFLKHSALTTVALSAAPLVNRVGAADSPAEAVVLGVIGCQRPRSRPGRQLCHAGRPAWPTSATSTSAPSTRHVSARGGQTTTAPQGVDRLAPHARRSRRSTPWSSPRPTTGTARPRSWPAPPASTSTSRSRPATTRAKAS